METVLPKTTSHCESDRFRVDKESFRIILVGKDGGVKR